MRDQSSDSPGPRFWYVCFQFSCGHIGNFCYKQHGRYLNFVAVTKHLSDQLEEPVSVTFWKEIPRAHYEQYQAFNKEQEEPETERGTVLRLVPDESNK